MFTGLVENTAKVVSLSSAKFSIELSSLEKKKDKLGDSVSVNGVCLTVSDITDNKITFDVSHETVEKTGLVKLKPGDYVNIERSMSAEGRFHGHFVTGHVDTVAKVMDIKKSPTAWDLNLVFEDNVFFKWTADKGSICVNGISLTINKIEGNKIRLTLIPHTLEKTNLIKLSNSDLVNIEFDILSKYIESLIFGKQPSSEKETKNKQSTITEEKLRELGYVK